MAIIVRIRHSQILVGGTAFPSRLPDQDSLNSRFTPATAARIAAEEMEILF